ncbi:MAG: 7-cyano-7-deazaguanine synthase QueC [Candidatus Krumholzibacteriota bacterium]|nr:7-cyano-7-deazaguanine synthase QueC [Candidatus Krumholzibacteriota bacterium]
MSDGTGKREAGTGRQEGRSAVVLLSGGLDSTVSLAISAEEGIPSLALFFDYNQKALAREERAAVSIAGYYGLEIRKVELPWLGEISSSAIISRTKEIPDYSGSGAEGREDASRSVWVENRNGIFINAAAAFAAAWSCEMIVTGFNREEASAFPDNSFEYLEAANKALRLSVGSPVRVAAPTISMGKKEIVSRGIDLDIPWELIWSCYGDGELMCGICESCVRFQNAVAGSSAEKRVRFSKGG